MKVGAAIYSMLKDDSAVAALVGTRIYPELAEEGAATPYVVYSVVSNTPVDTKDSAPVDEAQLEVFSVADTYAAANDLADKVRAALSRQSKKVLDTVAVQSIKYTNEVTEVSAARDMFISVQDYTARITAVPLFLDVFSGAHAAYSLRKMRQAYTGAAIRIRRAATTDKLDIGFDASGNLDTAAINTFAAGSACVIETLYDQSGNENHVTQTSIGAQPRIRHATDGVDEVNGKSAMRFNGNTHTFPFDSSGLYINNLSTFVVCSFSNTSGTQFALDASGITGDKRWYAPLVEDGNFNYMYGEAVKDVTSTANTNQNLHTVIAGSTQGNMTAFLNGSSVGSRTLVDGIDNTTTGIGSSGGASLMNGYIQEIVVYNSDQSPSRADIENAINTHYSIY